MIARHPYGVLLSKSKTALRRVMGESAMNEWLKVVVRRLVICKLELES